MSESVHIYFSTPLGEMKAAASEKGVCSLEFVMTQSDRENGSDKSDPAAVRILQQLHQELAEYFDGKRKGFSVPLDPAGTDFQRLVWKKLQEVSYGENISYMTLAERLGNPKAVRAVAGANGSNGIAILVPCHRIIGGNGELTGYKWGLERKKQLISLERRVSGKHVQMEMFV